MTSNRPITIYTAGGRRVSSLQAAPMDIAALFERLRQSQTIPATHDTYIALPKARQDDLKDVGAYIAGELRNGSRRAGSVLTRCAAVLDADNMPAGCADDLLHRVESLGCCYCVHSTAKHSPAAPRLRIVIPFSEDIPAEQYSPVVRLLCRLIQPEMAWFDPTTDEAGRIMYWPTHCQDVAPVWALGDKNLLDAAALLAWLPDWHDVTSWPSFPQQQSPATLAAKQADPESKDGVVGAFCKAYSVPEAMDTFLPGVYEETLQEGRYTFTGGSTYGGAVLYDDGKFLFSHHATDPAGGRLVNAFDLVRLHMFGNLDDNAVTGTPTAKMPSYTAMIDFARKEPKVSDIQARKAFNKAFEVEPADPEAALALGHCAGEVFSLDTLRIVLKAMGVTIRRNLITGRVEIDNLPSSFSEEEAINTLPILVLDKLHAVGVKGGSLGIMRSYMASIADENRYNPVLDMLHGTEWDGKTRLPELLDIIGIDPKSFYARLICKWLIQCVAMAHNDQKHQEAAEGVLTIQGAQGAGKTMLLRRLSIRSEWFAEGITLDLKNKDDILRAIGAWITELGELDSTLKKEQSSLKAFITQRVDRVRAPYAAESVDRPRRTSFGATVNPDTFLKDNTGDRRFWVVPITALDIDRLLKLPEEWFIQLWAEEYLLWRSNPQGFRLTEAEREQLSKLNQAYREDLPGEAEIREELDYDLPEDQWSCFTPAEFRKSRLIFDRLTSQQIGCVLAKLAREDDRITFEEDGHRVKSYRLPMKKVKL